MVPNLTCQPEDMQMLQRVYKGILREDWFDRTAQNERDFARAVIAIFQHGVADEELLFAKSLALARTRYSRTIVGEACTDIEGCAGLR